MNEALSKAIEIVDGQTKLAKAISKRCGKTILQSHITTWLHRSKKGVPAEYCKYIEIATNGAVTAAHLRPDVFGVQRRQMVRP